MIIINRSSHVSTLNQDGPWQKTGKCQYVSCRVSNLVVVDADDTNWHQRWQCQHWMTPIDTRMNWKIIYAGPAGLWKYNKIWSSGKCFWIHETSEMNFLQFLSNLAMKEENYFLGIPKIWVFSSHTTTKL